MIFSLAHYIKNEGSLDLCGCGTMSRVLKSDWYFIISASAVFVGSLALTGWDFVVLQGGVYRLGLLNGFGLAFFVAGVCLRVVSKRTIAKSYSYILRTSKPKELVKRGVYRFIRHPIYFALLLYGAGIPLFFASFYGFIVSLGFLPCVLYRIRVEEEQLIREFGEKYIEYKKRTKKLIPHIY